MPKHVIFLGAGASKSSGYPLADTLRKDWLASANVLRIRFREFLEKGNVPEINWRGPIREFDEWVKPLEPSLDLFRNGCFGTIDEFCKLIRLKRSKEVADLKKLIRFVFAIQHPEYVFSKSDYYPFIQRLFLNDLLTLRDDIAVMSFNYDIYLEWLLRRACITRKNAIQERPNESRMLDPEIDAAVTSGFIGGEAARDVIRNGKGFCLLKLHGMIAWPKVVELGDRPATNDLPFGRVFESDAVKRTSALLNSNIHRGVPPIAFPWELMTERGDFVTENDFSIIDQKEGEWRHGGRTLNDPSLYSIFKETWLRAQKEVGDADKISFIGISMHEYLEQGFRFLFNGKIGEIDVAVTDPDHGVFSGEHRTVDQFTAHSPPARVLDFFDRNCRKLKCHIPATGRGADQKFYVSKKTGNALGIREDFADFIVKDMGSSK